MLTEKEAAHISKFLSLVLRHQPETINIELDTNGWTDVDTLIVNSYKAGVKFDIDALKYVVKTNTKKRFSFNDAFTKIRASQGHSVEVELGYLKQAPPEILYHGTGNKSLESIMQTGINKKDRQHVHLSHEIETAIKVGQRHGKPAVIEVLASDMYSAGFEFYLSDNGVWLTDDVPVEYLRLKE